MDSTLAVLFYMGVIVPTIITIIVFIGFLICLYQRNKKRTSPPLLPKQTLPSRPSISGSCRSKKSSNEKFDSSSQHSADSAIDMREIDTASEKIKITTDNLNGGVILNTKQLGKNNHPYQNEGVQITAEVEIHSGGIIKGQYPSHDKLEEEVRSQVKIYERVIDAQRIALQLQMENELDDKDNDSQQDAKNISKPHLSKQTSADRYSSRYTPTSKLVPATSTSKQEATKQVNNQLSNTCGGGSSNYAFVSSWYDRDTTDCNNRPELYRSQYHLTPTWKPNIMPSCSSITDNYSTTESSQV